MASSSSRSPLSGGFLLALSLIVGVGVGMAKGQPTIGFLGGLGVGIALLVIVWLVDRVRSN